MRSLVQLAYLQWGLVCSLQDPTNGRLVIRIAEGVVTAETATAVAAATTAAPEVAEAAAPGVVGDQ